MSSSKAGVIQSTAQSQWFCWLGTFFLHFLLHADWCLNILALFFFFKLMLDLGLIPWVWWARIPHRSQDRKQHTFWLLLFWGPPRLTGPLGLPASVPQSLSLPFPCPRTTYSSAHSSPGAGFLRFHWRRCLVKSLAKVLPEKIMHIFLKYIHESSK